MAAEIPQGAAQAGGDGGGDGADRFAASLSGAGACVLEVRAARLPERNLSSNYHLIVT